MAPRGIARGGARHRLARGQEIELHWRPSPPLVAVGPEQGLQDSPRAGRPHGKAVEEAQRMRVLAGLDTQRERARAEDEPEHGRIVMAFAAHGQRAADQPPAGTIGLDRPFERPVGRGAEIDVERIGLALGQHGNCRPAVGKHRLSHGQHVAHRAIAAVDDQEIDPVPCEPRQRMRDFLARARLRYHDGAGAGQVLPLVAVAARIIDDADARLARLRCTVDRPALGRCRGSAAHGQAVEIVDLPVHQPCALIRPAGAYLGHFRHIVMVGHRFLGCAGPVGGGQSPASTATRMRSTVVRVPSRCDRIERCIFTVFSDRPSSAAICLLSSPFATSLST